MTPTSHPQRSLWLFVSATFICTFAIFGISAFSLPAPLISAALTLGLLLLSAGFRVLRRETKHRTSPDER